MKWLEFVVTMCITIYAAADILHNDLSTIIMLGAGAVGWLILFIRDSDK